MSIFLHPIVIHSCNSLVVFLLRTRPFIYTTLAFFGGGGGILDLIISTPFCKKKPNVSRQFRSNAGQPTMRLHTASIFSLCSLVQQRANSWTSTQTPCARGLAFSKTLSTSYNEEHLGGLVGSSFQ